MYSVGIDVQDIKPFREKPYVAAKRFHERIFTAGEIERCAGRADAADGFAARFAAKEAVMKALGPKRIFAKDIEISQDPDGRPFVTLRRKNVLPENHAVSISISHTGDVAAAVAIVHPL